MIARAIAAARRLGKPIGICGQAPSDYPEFAAWLVDDSGGPGMMSRWWLADGWLTDEGLIR